LNSKTLRGERLKRRILISRMIRVRKRLRKRRKEGDKNIFLNQISG